METQNYFVSSRFVLSCLEWIFAGPSQSRPDISPTYSYIICRSVWPYLYLLLSAKAIRENKSKIKSNQIDSSFSSSLRSAQIPYPGRMTIDCNRSLPFSLDSRASPPVSIPFQQFPKKELRNKIVGYELGWSSPSLPPLDSLVSQRDFDE